MRAALLVTVGLGITVACGNGGSSGALCVSSETRACVGPAACSGVQQCSEDGRSWSDCDCGDGTGGEGTGGHDGTGGTSGDDDGGAGAGGDDGTAGDVGTGGDEETGGAVGAGGRGEIGGDRADGGTAGTEEGDAGGPGIAGAGGHSPGTGGVGGGPLESGGAGGATLDGGGGAGGAATCTRGPGGYCWVLWADADSTANWVEPLDAARAHVQIEAEVFQSAGMSFVLGDSGEAGPRDLSIYDEMVFDADVAVGQPFFAGLAGADGDWCSWRLVGMGDAEYVIDLSSPSLCGPSACGWHLQATAASFSLWGGPEGDSADIQVTRVEFRTTGSGAGTATAGDAGIGPGNRCWSTFTYDGLGSASWVELTTDIAHAYTEAASGAQAGMAVEMAPSEQDMSAYSALEFDGEFTGVTTFEVLLSNGLAWCWYNLASGSQTFSLDLTDPDGCEGTDFAEFGSFTEVPKIEFKNHGQPELEMSVTAIRLVE